MSVKDRVAALLASLGDTPDDVAASLRKRRITGTPEDPCHCPIANLIRAEIPESRTQEWTTDPGRPGWFVSSSVVFTPDGAVKLPPPVGELIEHFDGYPAAVRYDYLRSDR